MGALLKKQNPIALSGSAWCPGGLTQQNALTARPDITLFVLYFVLAGGGRAEDQRITEHAQQRANGATRKPTRDCCRDESVGERQRSTCAIRFFMRWGQDSSNWMGFVLFRQSQVGQPKGEQSATQSATLHAVLYKSTLSW